MTSRNGFKRIVELMNSGKKYPAAKLVRESPERAAYLSKLVRKDDIKTFDFLNKQGFYNLDTSQFHSLTDSVSDRIKNSENALQLFPDIELASQILISSILSPKDMVNSEIIYKITDSILPNDVIMSITELIKDEINNYYNLKNILPDILNDCLFVSGSYVKVILPESSVDEIINGDLSASTESFREIYDTKSIGILGNATTIKQKTTSLESLNYTPINNYNPKLNIDIESLSNSVEITDNFKYLKLPYAVDIIRNTQVSDRISSSLENYFNNSKNLEVNFFRKTNTKEKPFEFIKTKQQTKRKPVGRPLEIKLPTESVIPVFTPGDVKDHVGYFVLIDEDGNPVTSESNFQMLSNMNVLLADKSNSITSMLTQKAKNNLMSNVNQDINIDAMTRIYMDIVESDLKLRLINGVYGKKLELSKQQEIYRVMLARSLSSQFTRILYIPNNLVTYFALKFHKNGTGKSLLDDLRVILSLRAILMFSKVMAQAKSSINLTHVNMTLDPNDPDPQKTIELSINEIIKMRQQYFPLGINTPTDLVDWIQRAGFEFSFEGHPGLPQTKFDFESKNLQHQIPDADLDESLRKMTIMAFGLSPETVDNGFASEFATTVVSNNILLSKRVLHIQEKLIMLLKDYINKIIDNDFNIRKKIYDIVKQNESRLGKYLTDKEIQFKDNEPENFYDYIITKISSYIEISLPKPNITTITTQSAAFDEYADALDKTIQHWISSEFLTQEIIGETTESIDAIKATLKAYYLRKWMAENGYMTELSDMVASDEDGEPCINIYNINKEHIQGILKSSLLFIKHLENSRIAANKDITDMNIEGSGSDGGYSSSDDDSSDDSKDSGAEGEDDVGLDATDDFTDIGGKEDPSASDVDDIG